MRTQTREESRWSWPSIRRAFRQVHLWMGLASGLIVVVVCLSGTLYVFNTELTELSASHLYSVKETGGERVSPDGLISKIESESGGKVVSVTVPESRSRSYQFNVRKEGSEGRGGTAYMVNPYTGEILGNSKEPNAMKEFMSTMFSLHRWLLLDKVEKPILTGMTNRELGSKITGWATILFTLGCITGLLIWIPKKLKNWKQGLKIKFNSNWKRLNHDLHNTLGFYALFFLLLMGLTGPQWSFEWYREGLQKTLGTYKPRDAQKPGAGKAGKEKIKKESIAQLPVSVSRAVDIAKQEFDRPGDVTVMLPSENSPDLIVNKYQAGFFASPAADRLTIDASSAVKKKEIFRDKPFNERVAGSIKALHVGNVYGMFSKIIYFFACLIATSLPITGTMIWINKLKKNRKKKSNPRRVWVREEAVA